MINRINIFYSSKIGRGLEPVQGKGLETVQTKKGKECKKNAIKSNLKDTD